MTELRRTPLHDRHVALGARMVEFGGWHMPLNYAGGIFEEHLATRRGAGLFDVSHMGRFVFRGAGAAGFLQRVLTNDASALAVGQSQYTMVPDAAGGAVDDAYLYRFVEDEYLLVVNAANLRKDWDHFRALLGGRGDVELTDRSEEIAMLSLQGPRSGEILQGILDARALPPPRRNALAVGSVQGLRVLVARTGYTGEPVCFELLVPREGAQRVWDLLLARGAVPIGLGARDTLRLEACLPLYGHELGTDPEGKTIPIFACPLARFAVSFAPAKGDFVGRGALTRQGEALRAIGERRGEGVGRSDVLPRVIHPLAVPGKAIARAGARVLAKDGSRPVGWVTSGSAVPYWVWRDGAPTDAKGMRSVALALLDGEVAADAELAVEVRGRLEPARVVSSHLRPQPPFARALVYG